MKPRRPRSLRTRVWISLVVGVVVSAGVTTVAFNLMYGYQLARNADRELRNRSSDTFRHVRVGAGGVSIKRGSVPENEPLEWVYAGGRSVSRPSAPDRLQRAADQLQEVGTGYRGVGDDWIRLYAELRRVDGRPVTVVSGLRMSAYAHARDIVLRDSIFLFLVVVATSALLGRRAVAAALAPVRHMTGQVGRWSVGRAIDRFGLAEPYDELSELAWTFDRLLDRVAASMRREQRFSAEVSHELRHPVAALIAEAELALRKDRDAAGYQQALGTILTQARAMAATIETLAQLGVDPSRATEVTCDARGVVEHVVGLVHAQDVGSGFHFTISAADRLPGIGADSAVVERILMPLVTNACAYGVAHLDIGISHGADGVEISLHDDGSGIGPDELERVFEPGVRGRTGSAAEAPPGSGLGLSLARRLARIIGGDVVARPSDAGAHVVVRLPAG